MKIVTLFAFIIREIAMLASMATRMDFLVSNSSLVGGRVKKTLQTRFVGRIEVRSRKIGQKLCAFCRKLKN